MNKSFSEEEYIKLASLNILKYVDTELNINSIDLYDCMKNILSNNTNYQCNRFGTGLISYRNKGYTETSKKRIEQLSYQIASKSNKDINNASKSNIIYEKLYELYRAQWRTILISKSMLNDYWIHFMNIISSSLLMEVIFYNEYWLVLYLTDEFIRLVEKPNIIESAITDTIANKIVKEKAKRVIIEMEWILPNRVIIEKEIIWEDVWLTNELKSLDFWVINLKVHNGKLWITTISESIMC